MLKILFGLLLLINGGLFAYQQGYLDTLTPPNREPSRMTQQLNADQLTLLATNAANPSVTEKAIEKPDIVTQVPEQESNLARADKISNVLACTEVGNFDATEAKRFETQLAALALGDRLTRRVIAENPRQMVYIPSQGSKEAAEKKAGELKRLGVEDFFIIQDNSPLQWGISLGIFRSEEAARNQLAALNQKGVRSARVGAHTPAASRVAFQLRALDAAAKDSIAKIKEGFPKQELRECSAVPAA